MKKGEECSRNKIIQWFTAVLTCLVVTYAHAQTADIQSLAAAMKQGGYVIVFRHGATNRDQADTDPLNFDNTAKQRVLSEQGKRVATQVGDAFKKLGIPLGKVYTSKFNRAVETGKLMSGGDVTPVTHKPNILDAFGKDWFDVKEGEASIFRPDGAGKTVLVARLQAVDWIKAGGGT